jgi:hypothetical protein
MKTFSRALALAAATLLALSPPLAAVAQTYPSTTPTYIPTAVLAPASLSAPGSVTFITNGVGTLTARLTGTYTGLTGIFEGTSETGTSPTWTQIRAVPVGGRVSVLSVSANGYWRVNTTGFAKVRFRATAISTGSVTVAMSGTPAAGIVQQDTVKRETYSAAFTGLSPAASATDFFTLTGSASVTVRIKSVECSGISTAAATATIVALRRSTANSAGTSSALTATKHDSQAAAASATALSYTANPTTGTLAGNLRAGKLSTVTAASTALAAPTLRWIFGDSDAQDVVLRGTAEVFALNGAGASFSSGTALDCSVTWTEE